MLQDLNMLDLLELTECNKQSEASLDAQTCEGYEYLDGYSRTVLVYHGTFVLSTVSIHSIRRK